LIDPLALQSARSSIRHFLKLPEEEIVDLVMLAAILCNFDPERLVPIWLIVVGSPSSGKTEITSLVRDWTHTWALPARLSGGYFFSARNREDSALAKIDRSGKKLLYIDDLAGVLSLDINAGGMLYSQLIAIHDGHLTHSTGFNDRELVYGPKLPAERLGFLGSATEKFYGFQERWFQFGSRFMVYYLADAKREWDDYGHLSRIAEMAEIPHHREHAKEAVKVLLDEAAAKVPAEFPDVAIAPADVDRLSAAVTLVQRVLGAGRSNDPGIRLHRRVVQLVRMMAYLQGRMRTEGPDVAAGIRLVISQLPVQEHKVLRYALEQLGTVEGWSFGDLLEFAGSTRKIYAPAVEALADVRVLRRAGQRGNTGYRFELHPKSIALVNVFDPERSIFPR